MIWADNLGRNEMTTSIVKPSDKKKEEKEEETAASRINDLKHRRDSLWMCGVQNEESTRNVRVARS